MERQRIDEWLAEDESDGQDGDGGSFSDNVLKGVAERSRQTSTNCPTTWQGASANSKSTSSSTRTRSGNSLSC